MIVDVGFAEMVVIAVIALLVLGPEKLPRFAADAGRFVRTVRRMAADARAEVQESLGPEFDDLRGIGVDDLNPRRFASRHLLDGWDDADVDDDAGGRGAGAGGGGGGGARARGSEPSDEWPAGSSAVGSSAVGSSAVGSSAAESAAAYGAEIDRPSSAASSAASGAASGAAPRHAEERPPYDLDAT